MELETVTRARTTSLVTVVNASHFSLLCYIQPLTNTNACFPTTVSRSRSSRGTDKYFDKGSGNTLPPN
ncbi:hypothetical protein IF2G_07329 [Cordyceps javanica]|nr:hypothetical protein IF2G_07329 [Cordyceps javanica]